MGIKSILCSILGCPQVSTSELPSPKIRIKPEQVHIVNGILNVTGLDNCYIAGIASTNSMEPVIDDGMFVILDPTIPASELIVGDIIYYESPGFKAIHRIVEIDEDGTGKWQCRCKGDNNEYSDGIIIRPDYIKGVLRGIII